MKAFKEFKFWFAFCNNTTLYVCEREHPGHWIAKINRLDNTISNAIPDWKYNLLEIADDLNAYLDRPEGAIYRFLENPEADYDEMFTCAMLGRAYMNGQNPDEALEMVQKCLNWLHNTDFYTAPASSKYHDSVDGGLLQHTLKVMHIIMQLVCGVGKFKSQVDIYQAIFVAAVHDWCKIGMYKPYNKNVKDPVTGQWYQETAYMRNEEMFVCLGHGVSSAALAQRFFILSMEEIAAIRWHMGAWRVCPSEQDELQQANENYPLVHALQFADQLSIVKY